MGYTIILQPNDQKKGRIINTGKEEKYSETHFAALSKTQNLRILLPSLLRDSHAKKANSCGCSLDEQAKKARSLQYNTD